MTPMVTGMFRERASAETAVSDLHTLGYTQSDISVMIEDGTIHKQFSDSTGGHKTTEGLGTGAAIGGALGAIIAGLTATGSIIAIAATGGAATPLVAGPLAAVLAGLGAGGIGGGLIGALIGAGIPEDRAKLYDEGLKSGGILVGVNADGSRVGQVRAIFERNGATDIQAPLATAMR
jgi:hypothetical protein